MKLLSPIIAVIALAVVTALAAVYPAHAQNMYVQVVPQCGVPNVSTPTVATFQPATMDQLGQFCGNFKAVITAYPTYTPAAGAASVVSTGGTPVTAANGSAGAPIDGCYLVNPATAADQGIGAAENLYVNPVTTATTSGNGTTSAIQPGQPYNCVPGMINNLSVNAATSGHKFNLVVW